MRFILFDLELEKNSINEEELDNKYLKEAAFGAKYSDTITKKLYYKSVLTPLIPYMDENSPDNEFEAIKTIIEECIQEKSIKYSDDVLFSLYTIFDLSFFDKEPKIRIINYASDSEISYFYTDGSFSGKESDAAGYSCCKLLEESSSGLLNSLSGKHYKYQSIAGKIENGTNNIGELTGLKKVFENLDNTQNIIIISSDSIYSLKTYREYIHVWKNNGYRTYAKKPIKNKELICETFETIKKCQNENKIVLFRWLKGHNNDQFNELCDQLAKSAIGL